MHDGKSCMNDWISVKEKMPPFGEFVEVIYPDDSRITEVNRDFAAYWEYDSGCFWNSAGMDERDWSKDGYRIEYWRPMSPDVKGRKPFLKQDYHGYFEVYLKKVD